MDDLSLLRLLDSCHKDEVEEVHGIVRVGLEARRSPWVVNTLVDYYFRYGSFEALSLLKTLPEIQAQCLFDKLNDALQKRETRIPSLELLLQLGTAQLSWLYRVIDVAVYNSILKLLKTHTDVIVLTYAVYVVAAILPLSPIAVAPHLADLFEVFSRLVTWKDRGKAARIPRLLLLHLEGGVYHFFLQLYAMFPCNFVNYLKARYGPKGEAAIFKKHIAELFAHVQIHPHLIAGDPEAEKDRRVWYHYNPHEVAVLDSEISLDPSIAPPALNNPLSLLHLLGQIPHSSSVPASTASSPLKKCPEHSIPTSHPSTSQGNDTEDPVPHEAGVSFLLGSIEEEVEHLSNRVVSARPLFLPSNLQESQSSDHSGSHHSSTSERTSSASTVRGLVASDEVAASSHVGTLSAREVQSLWSPSESFGMAQSQNLSQQSSIASLHSSTTGSGVPSLQVSCLPSPALDHSLRSGTTWPTGLPQPPANAGTYSPTASTLSAYIDDGSSNVELDNSVGSTGRFPSVPREAELLVRSLPASSFNNMQPVATSSAFNSPTRSFKGSVSPHAGRRDSAGVFSSTWSRLKNVFRSSPERRSGPQFLVEDKDEDVLHDYYNINVSVVEGRTVVSEDLSMSTVDGGVEDLSEEVLVQRSVSSVVERSGDEMREEGLLGEGPEVKQERMKQANETADSDSQELTNLEQEATPSHAASESSSPKDRTALERKLSSSLPTSPHMAIPQRSHNSSSFPPAEDIVDQEVDPTQQRLRALLRHRRPSFVLDSPVKKDTMSSSCPASTIATPRRTGSFGRMAELQSPTSSTLRLLTREASDPALQGREPVSTETAQVSSDLHGLTESNCSKEGGMAHRTTSMCSTGTLVAPSSPLPEESETGLKQDLRHHREQVTPMRRLHGKISPIQQLDVCLQNGANLHFFEETDIPLTALEGTSWSHFGVCPHQEALAVVQCHAGLLRSKLLYERYKCQQHIQRSRLLASQASRTSALTEEVKSREQKNVVLERTVQGKELTCALMKEQCRRESEARQHFEDRAKKEIHSYQQKALTLLEENSLLKEDLKALTSRNQDLLVKLEKAEERLFYMENKHSYLQQEVSRAKDMEGQLILLKKERLVLGEWMHQQSSHLSTPQVCSDSRSPGTPGPTTVEGESSLQRDQVALLEKQVAELKEQMHAKDTAVEDAKTQMESQMRSHKADMKVLEERLVAESLNGYRLQATVMELQAQLSGLARGTDVPVNRERGKQRSSLSTVAGRKKFLHRRTSSQPTGTSQFKDTMHYTEPSGSNASSSSAEEQQTRPRSNNAN